MTREMKVLKNSLHEKLTQIYCYRGLLFINFLDGNNLHFELRGSSHEGAHMYFQLEKQHYGVFCYSPCWIHSLLIQVGCGCSPSMQLSILESKITKICMFTRRAGWITWNSGEMRG